MLVSIIVPVYNVEAYLNEALNSVVHQSYKNIEIIIIDDGSTDGSADICDSFARIDERICVIHQSNKGLSAARNAGLEVMTGEVVSFLDSDDAYHTDFIKMMVEAMKRTESDIVMCKYSEHCTSGLMRVSSSREKTYPLVEPGLYDQSNMLQGLINGIINYSVWNKLYKKELWEKIRYPTGRVYEDVETTYQILDRCNRMFVLDQPLYLHRRRPNSITYNKPPQSILDGITAYRHMEALVEERIPDVFSVDHLHRLRRSRLDLMIILYSYYSKEEGNKGKARSKELMNDIICLRNGMGKESLDWHTEAGCRIIQSFPWMMKYLYPPFHALRSYVRTRVKNTY